MSNIEIPFDFEINSTVAINDLAENYIKDDGLVAPAYCGFLCAVNNIRTEEWRESFKDKMKDYDHTYWWHHFMIGWGVGKCHDSLTSREPQNLID